MAKNKYTPINTDLQLQKLRGKDKQTDIAIANTPGLVVRLLPSGKKTFRWNRGYKDKPRVIIYGVYPELSLQDAKELHRKTQQRHRDGVLIELQAEIPKTVAELAECFYTDRIIPHRKRPDAARQVLDHDIIPVIGSVQLSSVSTLLIVKTVKKVKDRGAPIQAGRVLAIIKQMLGYAASNGIIDYNPALSLNKKNLGITESQKNRMLTHNEIRAFWEALNNAPRQSMQTRIALQLLILLGIRSGELRQARWADIDWDKGLLTIPVEHQKLSLSQSKDGKPFRVPLDSFALDLFNALQGTDSEWIFPGTAGDKPINDKALGRVVRRLFEREALTCPKFSPHDLRRTMRSNLSDLGIPPHISEMCLNHSLGRIMKIYDHHEYLVERREALERWSERVQIILGKKGNVIAMEAKG